MKAKMVQSEVKAVTSRHKKALEERECELLWKVKKRGGGKVGEIKTEKSKEKETVKDLHPSHVTKTVLMVSSDFHGYIVKCAGFQPPHCVLYIQYISLP